MVYSKSGFNAFCIQSLKIVKTISLRIASLGLSLVGVIQAAYYLPVSEFALSAKVVIWGQLFAMTIDMFSNSIWIRECSRDYSKSEWVFKSRLLFGVSILPVVFLVYAVVLLPGESTVIVMLSVAYYLVSIDNPMWKYQIQNRLDLYYFYLMVIKAFQLLAGIVLYGKYRFAEVDLLLQSTSLMFVQLTMGVDRYSNLFRQLSVKHFKAVSEYLKLSKIGFLSGLLTYLYSTMELYICSIFFSANDFSVYRLAYMFALNFGVILGVYHQQLYVKYIDCVRSEGKLCVLVESALMVCKRIMIIGGCILVVVLFVYSRTYELLPYRYAEGLILLPIMLFSKLIVLVSGCYVWALRAKGFESSVLLLVSIILPVSTLLNVLVSKYCSIVVFGLVCCCIEVLLLLLVIALTRKVNTVKL